MLGMALAAAIGATVASSFVALLACMALLGAVYSAVQPGGTRAIQRWFPPQHRGLATGFRQAAVPLGTSIAAFALPVTSALHGWPTAMWLLSLVSAGGAAFFWALYREPAEPAQVSGHVLGVRALLRVLGEKADFWPVLSAGIAMSAFQFVMTAHAIGFMVAGVGIGMIAAASIFSFAQLLGIPGRILLPWLSDRYYPQHRSRSLAWTMLLAAASAAVLGLLPAGTHQAFVGLLFVPLGIFGVGWFPLYLVEIAEMAPRSSIASTVSFATTLCMTAMSLGPFVFGLVVDFLGYTVAWLGLVLPVAITAARLLRR
jgi:MFS family permease